MAQSACQQQIEEYLRTYLAADWLLAECASPELGLAPSVYRSAIEEVLQPLQQLVFLPGKRWRPELTLRHIQLDAGEKSAGQSFGPVVALVELLHNATLIADDIEDGGQQRRGIPALHLTYGTDRALNACNWCYFLTSALLRRLEPVQLARRLQDLAYRCLSDIHLGQALDIRWHRQHDFFPTPQEYFGMATLKTGALVGFAAEAGVLCGASVAGPDNGQVAAVKSLWLRVGRAFQVLDDLLNLTVGNPGKLRGDDLLEGKKSLPLCLFVHSSLGRHPAAEQAAGTAARRDFWLRQVRRLQRHTEQAGQADRVDQNSAEGLQLVLESVLAEFLSHPYGLAALRGSLSWLARELRECEALAGQLYRPAWDSAPNNWHGKQKEPAAQALLGTIGRLEEQRQRCQQFLAGAAGATATKKSLDRR